jgi:hypothetical protein
MATFVWDPAVRWPPPANILLNYDVVPPDPPTVQARDAPTVLHTFLPIHDALRVAIVDRDGSLPKEEKTPMTKVVIVGDLYPQETQIGGGPMPGGGWGGPVDPGYGRPGWSPVDPGYGRPGGPHPGNRPPGSWSGEYPSGQPVPPGGPVDPGWGGGWGGTPHPGGGPIYHPGHPSHGLPSEPVYPSTGPIVPPQGGTEVPEDVYTPAPVPEEIASQYVVTVYDPKTMTYTTKSYPPR